jgi:hypothetical protein
MATKNQFLKKANEQTEYTPRQVQELVRCAEDVEYFVDTYCQIQSAVDGAIPFKLRPYQKRILQCFKDNRLSIALAPRQVGKCNSFDTFVETLDRSRINTIKKIVLWVFDKKIYDQLFKNVH